MVNFLNNDDAELEDEDLKVFIRLKLCIELFLKNNYFQ